MVTEYHYHGRDDFIIDVELFSLDSMKEQVSYLLHAYRRYHQRAGSMETEDERQDHEELANLARDTFLTMFRGRLESEDYLLREPGNAVRREVASWVEELYPAAIAGKTTHVTAQDCSNELMRLTSEPVGAQGPSVWPFISVIRSGLTCSRPWGVFTNVV